MMQEQKRPWLSLPGRIGAAYLAFLLGQPAVAQTATIAEYGGICEASTGFAIDADRFVVADDESNNLYIYRFGDPSVIVDNTLARYLDIPPGAKPSDLEGSARIGDRTYWIGSHSNNDKGKQRPDRHRIFYARITANGAGVTIERATKPPFGGLLAALESDARFAALRIKEASEEAAKQAGGISIEGLAATPYGGLLIGFRNPDAPGGKAFIVELQNPGPVIDEGAMPVFADLHLVDLGKRGIRSMERIGNRYLIVAGPYGEPGEIPGASDFALYIWKGPKDGDPTLIPLPELANLIPEGLFASADGKMLHILSDDGKRMIGGKRCEKLDEKDWRFRMISIPMPPE